MQNAKDLVNYVATILEEFQKSKKQISYLASNDGQRLNKLLETEISRLQDSLKILKQTVLKCKKSWPKLHKKVLFLVFSLPEVPDLRASLETRMTGIERILNAANRNISGGKLDSNQFNALVAALQQPIIPRKQMNGKNDPERKAVKEALKTTGIADGSALKSNRAKQAHLLQALTSNGVSRKTSELVTQLCEQESTRAPAKPVKSSRSRGSSCEILVVDYRNGRRSLIAQACLEYYRVWVANNHDDWLFHRVESAGLNIKTPFRMSDTGKLATDPKPLKEPGREPDQTVLDAIASGFPDFRTDDRPNEKAAILERVQSHRSRGLSEGFASRYQYILTFEPLLVTALEKLQQRVLASSNKLTTEGTKKTSRIVLLPDITTVIGTVARDYVSPIAKALKQFLTAEFGYTQPAHSVAGGGLRTRFMQILLPAQMMRVEKEIERIERQSGCKVHLAPVSARYGWVISIVGLKERLAKAEEMVRQLRSSDR